MEAGALDRAKTGSTERHISRGELERSIAALQMRLETQGAVTLDRDRATTIRDALVAELARREEE